MTKQSPRLSVQQVDKLTAARKQGPKAWNALLDRLAGNIKSRTAATSVSAKPPGYEQARARLFGARLESLDADERALVAAAGWDEPTSATHTPLTADEDLAARAGWTD
jgi:hypothetical protein